MVRLGKKLVSNALLAAAAVSLHHAVAFALPAAQTQALDAPQTQRRPAFKLEQSTFKLNPLKQSAAPNEASLSIDANDVAGGKRGVAKKAVVFSTLAALILSQHSPPRSSPAPASPSWGKSGKEYDVPRAASFAAFDSCYRLFQHNIIPFIIKLGQGNVFASMFSMIAGKESIAFFAAMERTFLYQFILFPFVYYQFILIPFPVFFTFTGFMQGLDARESLDRAKVTFLPCWKRNLIFWIPTQMVMFGLVAEQWQIPYACVMGIAWSLILSVTAGNSDLFFASREGLRISLPRKSDGRFAARGNSCGEAWRSIAVLTI